MPWFKMQIQEVVTSDVWIEAETPEQAEEYCDEGGVAYQTELRRDYADGYYREPFKMLGEVAGPYRTEPLAAASTPKNGETNGNAI